LTRRKPPPKLKVSPPEPTPKPQGLEISEALIARLNGKRVVHSPEFDAEALRPYPPPPGVVPKGWKQKSLPMAMDSSAGCSAVTALSPTQYYTTGVYSQGWTFAGYGILSEYAQIAEYRAIAETIATEATREWIEFQAVGDLSKTEEEAKAEKIRKLEDAVKRFGVRDLFCNISKYDSFMGRDHLYIDLGTDQNDRDEMVKTIGDGREAISKAKCKKGALKSFKRVEAIWCYPANYDAVNPMSDDWYNPSTWFVMQREVHKSRLLRFVSREVPDILKPSYAFGGLALSQMAKPYIDRWLKGVGSVSDLIHAFSIMVLETDLQTSVQQDGQQLFQRAALFNLCRDNLGLMLTNQGTEEFKNVSSPLGTLDALLAQLQEHMAAVSKIPLVKLLGVSPAGLQASNEGEIRVFEDTIHAYQEAFFRPNLQRVIDFIQLSEFGQIDEKITFGFKKLHALSEKEQAEMLKAKADTHAAYVDMGSIDIMEVRKAVAADKDTPYPGLDVDKEPEPANFPENEMGEPVGARHILAQADPAEAKEAA
jgi:phage-related protein (TIGR01555 family)